jgi:hypothetical protein
VLLALGAVVVAGVCVIAIVVGVVAVYERHKNGQVRQAMRNVAALEQRYYADNHTYGSALAIPEDQAMSTDVYIVLSYDETGFCLVGYRAHSSGGPVATYDSARGGFGHEPESACTTRYRSHAYLTGTGDGTLVDSGG